MKLELFDEQDNSICKPTDDAKTLQQYGFVSGYHLHVSDPTLSANVFDNENEECERFNYTIDEYEQRDDSVLAFKRKNKLGRFRETNEDTIEKEKREMEQLLKEKERCESFKIGDRCEVRNPKAPTKRGVIKFIGETKFKPGMWVGVQYDEPLGKNNGEVNGVKYFECPEKYGGFVKPHLVEVGDFPELCIDELDEI